MEQPARKRAASGNLTGGSTTLAFDLFQELQSFIVPFIVKDIANIIHIAMDEEELVHSLAINWHACFNPIKIFTEFGVKDILDPGIVDVPTQHGENSLRVPFKVNSYEGFIPVWGFRGIHDRILLALEVIQNGYHSCSG